MYSFHRRDGAVPLTWCSVRAPSSIKRLKGRIHAETTRRWNGLPVSTRVEELNPVLRGWASYFSQGPVKRIYRDIDNYAARRVRVWLRRRSGKRGTAALTSTFTRSWD